MIDDLRTNIAQAYDYLNKQGVEIPLDIHQRVRGAGVVTYAAGGDFTAISNAYSSTIENALLSYLGGAGNVVSPRNAIRQATSESFYDVFYMGWRDAGGGLPDADGIRWLNARISQEYGYIDMLVEQARELRTEEGFDAGPWAAARGEGYARTLKEIYNAGYTRASKDVMVSFMGNDGAESCPDCQKYKGQRHRVSWFVRRNAVPPFGTGLQCHPGGRCEHYLVKDNGERITA